MPAAQAFRRTTYRAGLKAVLCLPSGTFGLWLAITDERLGEGMRRSFGSAPVNRIAVGGFGACLLVIGAERVLRIARRAPDLTLDDEGVHIRLGLTTRHVPWTEITSIEMETPVRRIRPGLPEHPTITLWWSGGSERVAVDDLVGATPHEVFGAMVDRLHRCKEQP